VNGQTDHNNLTMLKLITAWLSVWLSHALQAAQLIAAILACVYTSLLIYQFCKSQGWIGKKDSP